MIRQHGFSLIELAIVLVIVTLLLGGLTVPLAAQIQARRIAETQKTIDESREALIGYAMTHRVGTRPYLPCPDTDGDGVEEPRTTGACPRQVGWLPWVTLGVGAQDAWGNRLLYATDGDLSNDTVGIHNGVPSKSTWPQVCSTRSCTAGDVAANVAAVVISHGPNGWGALNVSGVTQGSPGGPDEAENLDQDIFFVSRVPTKPDNPAGEFDDLVGWWSYNTLFSRVCPAGGCP